MKKYWISLSSILLLIFTAGTASALPVLYDSGVTVNGAFSHLAGDIYSTPETGGVVTDVTGFSDVGGVPSALGSVTVTYNPAAAGDHSIFGWFDAEIDEGTNTYVNEAGAAGGTAATGQSGSVLLGSANPLGPGNDIALEIGWNFSLEADQWAAITFLISSVAPEIGTYFLSQTDLTSGETIYLTSSMSIGNGPPQVPEPAALVLLCTGLIGIGAAGRKRFIGK
jgi:hypothetical protein